MVAEIIEDAPVLLPNQKYKNFTQSRNDILKKGWLVQGEPKLIEGLKEGKPFTYRLFYTDKNQIIFLNKIQPMTKTEVTLGADSEESSGIDAIVNLKPAELHSRDKWIGVAVGATLGFAYSKFKKHEGWKKSLLYAFGGAVLGYAAAFIIDSKHKGTVTKN